MTNSVGRASHNYRQQLASFELGADGGVARFLFRTVRIWIELVRGLHSYVPVGYLVPTHVDLTMGGALSATQLILEREECLTPTAANCVIARSDKELQTRHLLHAYPFNSGWRRVN